MVPLSGEGQSDGGARLSTHLRRMSGAVPLTPHICLDGIDRDNCFCVGNNTDKRD